MKLRYYFLVCHDIFVQVMSPRMSIPMMSTLTLNSSSDSTTLSIPKLHDNGSNWSDYEPHIQRAMGSKGLWRHVEGAAIALKLYTLDHGILVLADDRHQPQKSRSRLENQKLWIMISCQVWENSGGNSGNSRCQVWTYKI